MPSPTPPVVTKQPTPPDETPFYSGPEVKAPMAGSTGSDATKAVLDLAKSNINVTDKPTSLALEKTKKLNVIVPPGKIFTFRFEMTDPTTQASKLVTIVLRNEKNARPRLASFIFDKNHTPMMRSEINSEGKAHVKGDKRLYKKMDEDQLVIMSDQSNRHLSKIAGNPAAGPETPTPAIQRGRDTETNKMFDKIEKRKEKHKGYTETESYKQFNAALDKLRATNAPQQGEEYAFDINTDNVETTDPEAAQPQPQSQPTQPTANPKPSGNNSNS